MQTQISNQIKINELPPFLEMCVVDLFRNHNSDLSNCVCIFPNRRPIVFIKKYIKNHISKPCFLPKFTTIQDFFISKQDLHIPNKLILINELHKVYSKHTQNTETLEDFYPWGEMLLNDFDDLDKYLINADDLFKNLSSIREFSDEFAYLSDEQKQMISRFWEITSKLESHENPKKFIDIWQVLSQIYHDFTSILLAKNIAYEGMAFRKVITNNADVFSDSTYYFIGFNALNACEHELFAMLQKKKQAHFYWDYDEYYNKNSHEAGLFISKNLVDFPHSLDKSLFTSFEKDKNISILEVSNPISQVKHIESWIAETRKTDANLTNSAIILADENLLVPLLYSIPPDVKYNISLGFPIKQTATYACIEIILQLKQNRKSNSFYSKDILQFCSHTLSQSINLDGCVALKNYLSEHSFPYISEKTILEYCNLPEFFSVPETSIEYLNNIKHCISIFAKIENLEDIDKSILYAIYKEIEAIENLITSNQIQVSNIAFINNLIKKSVQTATIPIYGEPLQGIQIMGILETRLLDFKNIIVLSVNENILPKKSIGSSFIPYSLRTGFGMPTIKEHNAMFAYYFYRLIQRAQNVTLVYTSQSDENGISEKSRYISQLQYEYSGNSPIQIKQIVYPLKPIIDKPLICNKTEETIAVLDRMKSGEKRLSPTSLYSFITCELQYYFKQILRIEPPKEIKELPDDRDFGNFFHKAMEAIYKPYLQTPITAQQIREIRTNKKNIEQIILATINEILYGKTEFTEGEGTQTTDLHYKITEKYINNLLQFDEKRAPFTISEIEKEVDYTLQIGDVQVHVGGIIDRIETTDSTVTIIDYKTGANKHEYKSIDLLFHGKKEELNSAVFQTLMYSFVEKQLQPHKEIQPQLFFIRDLHISDNTLIKNKDTKEYITTYSQVEEEFAPLFTQAITYLFDTTRPFTQTTIIDTCKYCDFNGFCKRK